LDRIGCFAMTETGHGSDVAALETTATFDVDTDEFVIHTPSESARKDYIGNAARDGQWAVVFAQLVTRGQTHGVHALLVPIRDVNGAPIPGVRIEDCGPKAGLNGVDNGRLWFDHVRIPRTRLLDRYGQVAADGSYCTPIANKDKRFFTMLGTLIQGRVSVAGGAIGATRVGLTVALRYAQRRRQFEGPGQPDGVLLLDYLTHQRRLLPALARTYALSFAQNDLVETLHASFQPGASEARRRQLEATAAGLKAVATWHATETIQDCRETCGGAGYLVENQLPALKADTDVFTTFEGDNTVLLQLVAKHMLTGYRDHVGELDHIGVARFFADQAWQTVLELTAARSLAQRLRDVAPGRDEQLDLLDRRWHVELFAWRERHLLASLARRLRRAASEQNAFDVLTGTQDHMLTSARAHVDRVLLDAFVAAIERAPAGSARVLLDRLCDLFVLSTIADDRGWFAEHGRLTARRSKAVLAGVNALCRTIRPHVDVLLEGFGIPEPAIHAVMLR
ncbi:MAG: acyl-CoA dehydrogenase family protein, partial [Actinobacteria bacterium]|nr:acyl-CoA dehydrogenase family protein [Actinomycetota bacterium]